MKEKNYTLNKTEDFNPLDEITDMFNVLGEPVISPTTGKQCRILRVDAKKTWFRKVYPEGAFTREIIKDDDDVVIVKACVYKNTAPDQLPLGTGYSQQEKISNREYPPLESASTIALGNALDEAGFGCEISMLLYKEDSQFRKAQLGGYDEFFGTPNTTPGKDEITEEELKKEAPKIKPLKASKSQDSTNMMEESKEESFDKNCEENVESTSDDISEEDDVFAILGVTMDNEETTDKNFDIKAEDCCEKEKTVADKEVISPAQDMPEKKDKSIKKTEKIIGNETHESSAKENLTKEEEPMVESNHENEITLKDAVSYVIKPEDNISSSDYMLEYVGRTLGDMSKRELTLLNNKLSLFMSEELKAHIKQLL